MLRDEQLLRAAAAMQADLHSQGYNAVAADNFADGFYEGALWADANQCWHKCEDEMPEPNVPVLAVAKAHNEYYHYVGYYDDDDECWRADIDDQTIEVATEYWTVLPEPQNSTEYETMRP